MELCSVTQPSGSMDYQIDVDRVSPGEWAASLEQFQDANLYQTWSYGAARWGAQRLSHVLLRDRENLVGMAQVVVVQPSHLRVGMAHLRWGPVCQRLGRDLDLDSMKRMAAALHEEYAVKRGLFLRVLPNAWSGTQRERMFDAAFSQYRSEPFAEGESFRTLVVDLTAPLEVLRKNLDQKWRNQLNRAERNGLTIREGDDEHSLRRFTGIYDQMLARKQFDGATDMREVGSAFSKA